MDIKRAELSDIEMLVDNRMEFVSSIRNIGNLGEFRTQTTEYIQKHLGDDSLVSYIAVDEGKIVASCILCIYETLPIPSCLNGRAGLLLNVYTQLAYRRQGLAYNLLMLIIEEAKRLGVGKIQLSYTDNGYPLYKKIGFKELDREMVLNL